MFVFFHFQDPKKGTDRSRCLSKETHKITTMVHPTSPLCLRALLLTIILCGGAVVEAFTFTTSNKNTAAVATVSPTLTRQRQASSGDLYYPRCHTTASSSTTTTLYMGGFNKAKNKQAELARKLKQVKEMKEESNSPPKNDKVNVNDEDDDDDVDDQHSEFAKLLADKKNLPTPEQPGRYQLSEQYKGATTSFGQKPPEPPTSNTPKIRAKDIKKKKRKAAVILEGKSRPNDTVDDDDEIMISLEQGDKGERKHFEKLLDVTTSKALGPIEAAKLVPWVPPYIHNSLVVLADPRKQSSELRQAIQFVKTMLDEESSSRDDDDNNVSAIQIIAISSDSVAETKSWLKRSNLLKEEDGKEEDNTKIRLFSDEKLEFMKMYSCVVNEERWSLSIMTLDTDGTIQTLERQVDPSMVCSIITQTTTNSMK